MKMDTLYVIDLQETFIDEANRRKVNALINNCIKVINLHKKLNHRIVIVEYNDCGKTHPRILKCIKNYNNVKTITKHSDSAFSILRKNKLIGNNCYFIGVNLGACVRRTCIDLYNKTRKISIYKSATKNMYNDLEHFDISELETHYKFNII